MNILSVKQCAQKSKESSKVDSPTESTISPHELWIVAWLKSDVHASMITLQTLL